MTMTDELPASRGNAPFKQAIVGGYDRDEVDAYVARLERRIEELEREQSPDGAVQHALEQVGDQVAGILQQAHETAAQLTEGARQEADKLRAESEERVEASRREAREHLEAARREADEQIGAAHRDAAAITENARQRLQELDVDADRIWAERERILGDVRYLSEQLLKLAAEATERFPPDEPGAGAADDGGEDRTQTFELEEQPELDGTRPAELEDGEGQDPGLAGD